jgi:hypothetical protein
MMPAVRPTWLIAIAAAIGCGEGLPLVDRIASVRPLAMRVEIVEAGAMPDDPVAAEGLPLSTARVVPFFADPDGPMTTDRVAAELEPVWIACNLTPVQGLFGCLGDARPLDVDELVDCPPVDPSMIDPSSGMLPTTPSPCRIATDTPGTPEYTIPIDAAYLLGGDIELTMVGHDPAEGTTEGCLEDLLDDGSDPPPECIYVVQRIAVGPDGALVQLAEQLGVPSSALPPAPDPVPDPDRHPRISAVRVTAFESKADDAPMIGVFTPAEGDVLQIPWGARLELEIEAPEDDLQTYVVPGDDGTFTDRAETYAGRWFRSWGDLLAPDSDDPVSHNTWTLQKGKQDETDVPDGGLATMIYVLRDDRQGVTWTWFQVEVQGMPPDGAG